MVIKSKGKLFQPLRREMYTKVWSGNLKVKGLFVDTSIEERTLRLILNK
jgi:hypothetical protein